MRIRRWSAALAALCSFAGLASVATPPAGAAAQPAFVYLANYGFGGTGSVDIVDATTQTVVKTVPVGVGPHSVTVAPDATKVYVVNQGISTFGVSGSVSVIDTATQTASAPVPLTASPRELGELTVTPDGSRLYVATGGEIASRSIAVVDTATMAVVKTIPMPLSNYDIAASPDGAFVYVLNASCTHLGCTPDDAIAVIDTATDTVVASISLGVRSYHFALAPDGAHAYVPFNETNSLAVVDLATRMVVDVIPVGVSPLDVAVAPDGGTAYVTNNNGVSVISTATGAVTASITASFPTELAVTPNGALVYALSGSGVAVIDAATNAVALTIPTGSRVALGITPGETAIPTTPTVLLQGLPMWAISVEGNDYDGQLTTTNASGAVTWTQDVSTYSSDVVVDATGAISAPATLPAGWYTVHGTMTDAAGTSGTWYFTLYVSTPPYGSVTRITWPCGSVACTDHFDGDVFRKQQWSSAGLPIISAWTVAYGQAVGGSVLGSLGVHSQSTSWNNQDTAGRAVAFASFLNTTNEPKHVELHAEANVFYLNGIGEMPLFQYGGAIYVFDAEDFATALNSRAEPAASFLLDRGSCTEPVSLLPCNVEPAHAFESMAELVPAEGLLGFDTAIPDLPGVTGTVLSELDTDEIVIQPHQTIVVMLDEITSIGPHGPREATPTARAAATAADTTTEPPGAVGSVEPAANFITDTDGNPVDGLEAVGLPDEPLAEPANVTLAPATATTTVGDAANVTATVTAADATPVPGAQVDFSITAGPNAGKTGAALTDADGKATFSYVGAGGAGTDTIEASVGDVDASPATNAWVIPQSGDALKCYAAKDLTKPKFVARTVSLQNELEAKSTDVQKPSFVCDATSVNGNGPGDTSARFVCDAIKDAKKQPRFVQTTASVENDFGVQQLKVTGAAQLCLQSTVNGTQSANALGRFECYKAATAKGQKFVQQTVLLADAFETKSTVVTKPSLVCVPVGLGGSGIPEPGLRVVCYAAQDAKQQAKFAAASVSATNEFGALQLGLTKTASLCLPSTITFPAPT
jgi:YVTN family beta-propeller protein